MKRNNPPKEKYEMTFEWNKQRLKIPVKQKRHHNLETIKKFTLSSNIWRTRTIKFDVTIQMKITRRITIKFSLQSDP